MPLVHIKSILVLVTWIHVLNIPIAMTLSSNVNTTKLEDDITLTKTESAMNKLNDQNKDFVLWNTANVTFGPHEFRERGLTHIKTASIVCNDYVYVDRTAFDGVTYLQIIEFRQNGRLDIHPDVFQNNSQLNLLSISWNKNFRINCNTDDYLFDIPRLRELYFFVNYKCWSLSTFTKLPNLIHLFLESPNFKILPGIFTPLRKLYYLQIYRINNLDIIKNAFEGMNSLRELMIVHSAVSSLANIQIARLKYLCLASNIMKDIGKYDFVGVPALEKLFIIDNGIKTIHDDAFSHLTQLKHLNISGNRIASITNNHFRNNFQLNILIMSDNNKLKNMPVFKLNSTRNENYTISQLDCYNCGLESISNGAFDAMPILRSLNLANNRLELLPNGLFEPLSSLDLLDLSNNLISNIPDNMFKGATKLSTLYLAGNPLTLFETTPFLQTPILSSLDLSQCGIKIWNERNSPFSTLRALSLRGNELERITLEQLETVPNLEKLDLFYNPIKCDNESKRAIGWLVLHHVKLQYRTSLGVFCDPSRNAEFCWDFFQKVTCDPSEISEIE